MSDRIAVMSAGKVDQIGRPREIYEHPQTAFVADFIGLLNAFDITVDELVELRHRAANRRGSGGGRGGRHGCDRRRGAARRRAPRARRYRSGRRGRAPGRLARRGHDRRGRLPRDVHAVPRGSDQDRGLASPGRRVPGALQPGVRVLLSWQADQTSLLWASRSSQSSLGEPPAELGGDDDEGAEDHHDDGDRDHLGRRRRNAGRRRDRSGTADRYRRRTTPPRTRRTTP